MKKPLRALFYGQTHEHAPGKLETLKCYVTSHLMWDPSKDWRALEDEFLNGYYGTAAERHPTKGKRQ